MRAAGGQDRGGAGGEGLPRRKPPRRAPSYEQLARTEPRADSELSSGADEDLEHLDSSKLEAPPLAGGGWRSWLLAEPLLLWTLVGVLAGVALGLLLKLAQPSPTAIALIGEAVGCPPTPTRQTGGGCMASTCAGAKGGLPLVLGASLGGGSRPAVQSPAHHLQASPAS